MLNPEHRISSQPTSNSSKVQQEVGRQEAGRREVGRQEVGRQSWSTKAPNQSAKLLQITHTPKALAWKPSY